MGEDHEAGHVNRKEAIAVEDRKVQRGSEGWEKIGVTENQQK